MDLEKEKLWLLKVSKKLNEKVEQMEKEIFLDEEKIQEFRKYMWENKSGMDKQELNSVRTDNEQEAMLMLQSRTYFQRLLKIQDSPYFASITILNEKQEKQSIYIGMTYLKDENLDNLIYDWRAPVSSIFYDFEAGPVVYDTPMGSVSTHLYQKRQYKIEHQELLRIIDSNIHIEDEVLQEALARDSGERMKQIVTTIQQEQNQVIRNTKDKHFIVQGIAGSGKTSVALHRIAFLLYKIPNLTSKQILIFSPNQIFTEYISDVLPTLGEENTLQTTFHEYLNRILSEYRSVESYPEFLKRFYSGKNENFLLIQYKQSDSIIQDIEDFVKNFTMDAKFQSGICENHIYEYSKEELNDLFHHKYNQAPFFERIVQMATKFSEQNYHGSVKKRATYQKLLIEALRIKKNYTEILKQFFESQFFHAEISCKNIKALGQKNQIHYEDALLLAYLKGLLEGFLYDAETKQIVIDEAQDYSFLQYKILKQIFQKASFTILGDVNQTINPYYHYDSLEVLNRLWNARYFELNKTYRSSPEIIAFSNEILNLHHVSAIQKTNQVPVTHRYDIKSLTSDIDYLKHRHKSVAVITHDEESALELYDFLEESHPTILLDETKEFQKDFVIIPAYLAKGLEFDSVIVYQSVGHSYTDNEKNLYYVAVTRAQHELIVYSV